MSKKMLINATHPEENRVAIVEDGILSELDIEIAGKEQTKGNIYKAVVVRVEPGLQAAFIDYGGERFGFLQMGEIHPSYFRSANDNGDKPKYPRINDVLRRGQELLVQIVKEERGTKGAALTTYLSLPGRYMVLMPDSDTKGVSRKIEEEGQRKKLKEAMASLDLLPNMGYIVRTAGIGQKKEELRRDFDYLVRVYQKIQEHSRQAKAPALVYQESNLVIRSLRDYFSADMDEVLVDDPRVFQEARDFFQEVMPEYARLVRLHQEKRPIFSRYQIEEQIETIVKNKVPLPSGGSIVIDSTEALVAIDVNSGKMAGEQGVEATAYKTNLEAAAEAGRQLRLRDLGGLIVIDFIDMRDRKHIREIEKALKEALKSDKARVTVGRISQFGLLEMSRQRIKATLAEGAYLPCPHCQGSGRVKSAEAQAIAFLRKVHAAVAKGQVARVEGEIPLEVATYLLNVKREELLEMERRHQMSILIKGRPDFTAGQAELMTQKRDKDEAPVLDLLPAVAAPPSPPEPEPLPAAAEITGSQSLEEREESAEEEAARKKRKRKRRKKKPEEVTEAAAGQAAEEIPLPGSVEPPSNHLPQGEETATQTETHPVEAEKAEETAANAEEAIRKKRKRRRRKKKPEEVATEDKEAVEEIAAPGKAKEPAAALLEAVSASDLSEEQQEDQQKKKRRRRRKKKPAATLETPEESVTTPGEMPAAEPAAERGAPAEQGIPAGAATAAGEEKPAVPAEAESEAVQPDPEPAAPPRRRRSTRPKASTAAEEQPTPAPGPAEGAETREPAPAQEAPTPAAEISSEAPAKKPAPRPRQKKATPAKTAQAAEKQALEEPPAEAPIQPERAENKPAPRRPTRRKRPEGEGAAPAPAPKQPAKQEAQSAAGKAAVETDGAGEKPKRRAPRKKAPVSKKEPETSQE